MSSVARISPSADHGEIDLFKLARNVWRRRGLVLGAGVLCALMGASYTFLVTPVYEVSTTLRPVARNQLDALNRSQIYSLPPNAALKSVGAALDSYNTRLDFYRSRPDLISAYQGGRESLEQGFEDFNRSTLSVIQPDPKKTDLLTPYIGLKMRYEKGIDGARVLNDFIDYAVERERVQLSQDLRIILANRLGEIDSKLSAAESEYQAGKESSIVRLEENDAIKRAVLNDELKALRVQLRLRREARLAQLEEAISIAKSLGLKKPSTPSLMAEEGGGGNVIRTEVNSQSTPLYFLGTDVLEAERNALRKRTSDDFVEPRIAQIRKELIMLSTNRKVEMLKSRENEAAFLEGIEALRAERARLQGLDTNVEGLQLVNIDQRAVASGKPVSPRKGLIILASFVGGVVIGILIALLRGAYKERLRLLRVFEIDGFAERVSMPEGGALNAMSEKVTGSLPSRG